MLNFQELADAVRHPGGGFTVRRTGHHVPSGYAVSVRKDLEERFPGSFEALTIAYYVAANWNTLAEPGAALGGWHDPDTGDIYLDVVRVVDTGKAAFALAAAHGQLAFHDIAKGETVRVA